MANGCAALRSFEGCPESVQTIKAADCDGLTSLKGLANTKELTKVNISRCKNLHSLEGLPPTLEEISASECPKITKLGLLPNDLKSLDLDDCDALESLEGVPDGLEKLYASRCPKIVSLGQLPNTLRTLYVRDNKSLKSLDGCPESLENLVAGQFYPSIILSFHATQTTYNTSVWFSFNNKSTLSCHNLTQTASCPSLEITTLEDLPQMPNLKDLHLGKNIQLKSLIGCPSAMEELRVFNCDIASLDGLSDLKRLDFITV